MKKIKRPLLQSGLIINLVSFSLLGLACLLLMLVSSVYEKPDIAGIYLVLFVFVAIAIVFICIGLSVCNKQYYIYEKKKGLIITELVIACIIIFLGVIGSISNEELISSMFIHIFSLIGVILTIVGHIQAKKNILNEETIFDAIKKLNELKEADLISEEEFNKLKLQKLEELNKK